MTEKMRSLLLFTTKDELKKLKQYQILEVVKELETLANNRGAFIDWVLEHYPDIAKEYTGFRG